MKKIFFHKYEVLKLIAEGGMGSVYLVKDLHLNKLAAVKVSKGRMNEAALEGSILQEKEVLKQLSHPALPQIIDFFEEEGNNFLVMEYVEGITLEQYLRKFGKVPPSQALKWGIELTEVLGYLHSQNPPVIYRDLKPANIIVQPDGRLRMIDFGTAFTTTFQPEKEMFLMGTQEYSAPEQWKSRSVGKECDIFALGAVLHELLTGMHPSPCHMERRPVREYDRTIPRELENVIEVCLKKRPSDRYQSMEQVREALSGSGKKRIRGRIFLGMKKGIGILLWILMGASFFIPLLKGVRETEFPFPFLIQPLVLLAAAVLYSFRIRGKRKGKQIIKKQEKSIFLTEKKFSGWYVAGILLLVAANALSAECAVVRKGTVFQWPGTEAVEVAAAEKKEQLWVEMRDEKNRKLLLKDGAVYEPTERVRFDIPCESLPDGKISMQILAVDEAGEIYESRVFLVEGN